MQKAKLEKLCLICLTHYNPLLCFLYLATFVIPELQHGGTTSSSGEVSQAVRGPNSFKNRSWNIMDSQVPNSTIQRALRNEIFIIYS